MLENRLAFIDQVNTAKNRLREDAGLYEKFLVSRMFAAILAIDFILRALERIGAAKKLELGKILRSSNLRERSVSPQGKCQPKIFAERLQAPCIDEGKVLNLLFL